MRLIDSDELLNKVNQIKYLRKIKAKNLVDECKPIEAIPIEWLRENKEWLDLEVYEDKIEALIELWEEDNERT